MAPFTISVVPSAPGVFTADSTGTGPAAALNQDGQLHTAQNPARAGDIIVLYATGEGQTSPPGVDGALSDFPYPAPIQKVSVTIGGFDAAILYAGAAPGQIAGLMQINARIPLGVAPGAVPVSIRIGNNTSQTGVTIVVRPQ